MMMPEAYRRIDNPVTGDRIEFLASPLHGDPGPLIFRCTLPPRAKGSPLHFHRTIAETFEVEHGALSMDFGGKSRRDLEVGEVVSLKPGDAHGFSNPHAEPVTFISTAIPGAQFEKFLRAMYGLAADGRTNADGMPTDPRSLALTLHYADLVIPALPRAAQSVLVGGLARLGRLMGVERDFERYWTSTSGSLSLQEAAR